MNTLIIHHTDADGYCAGAIAFQALLRMPATLAYNYGQPVPDLTQYDMLYLVDISLPDEVMFENRHKIIYLDHHKSALEKFVGFAGLQDTAKSGCLLTWEYFHPGIQPPQIVDKINKYDLWQHNNDEVILLAAWYGMKLSDLDSDAWRCLLMINEPVPDVVAELYRSEIANTVTSIMKNHIYASFCGVPVAFTMVSCNSRLMRLAGLKGDVMMRGTYNVTRDEWSYSLYSDETDVLALVKKWPTGGGHVHACGFTSVASPMQILERNYESC